MNHQPPLDRALIQQTLGYHGKPLQKIWESEGQPNELLRLGLDNNVDFAIYTARQRYFSFQDRTKRLKLHQFMARKAGALFQFARSAKAPEMDYKYRSHFAVPPLEAFLDTEECGSTAHLLQTVQTGDVVYGIVVMHKLFSGVLFRPVLIVGNVTSYVRNKSVKGMIANELLVTIETQPNTPRNFFANEMICCEVIDIAPDSRRLVCSMKRTPKSRSPESIVYGVLRKDDFPEVYKLAARRKGQEYEQYLESSPSFNDPKYIEQLYESVGLDGGEYYTNMSSLKGRYPSQEYAAELRNSQNSKWAFRSVAEGIEHFKVGRHAEAFQCLNKALSMDPRNVEGLVARGALYANSGSFKKAVEDFETALKLNPAHANARKYMGETLVALGRSYEDENRFEEARKAYQDCLNIIPHHEEAQNSLDCLKAKPFTGKQIVEPTELELPALNIVKPSSSDRNKQEPDTSGVGGGGVFGGSSSSGKRDHAESGSRKDRRKDSKKDRKKRHKKHHSSTSDSSSDSSDSSDSSSDSSSSSSSSPSTTSSDSSSSRNKKRKRSKNDKKPKSVSPMGNRRMAMGGGRSGAATGELVGYPIGGQGSVFGHGSGHGQPGMDDYEQKVRKFLEMPRDEEDYEEKVRRFVAEASKYQKERKQLEDKSKKKKKKDEKKAKKESKKKRKSDEKKKSKKRDKSGGGGGGGADDDGLDKDKLREALKIFENFPVLDELGSKLSVGGSVAEALSALFAAGSASGGGGVGAAAGTSRAKPTDMLEMERGLSAQVGVGGGGGGGIGDDNAKDGKWRMMFKDKRPAKEPVPTATITAAGMGMSALKQQQHPFSNESDDESTGGGRDPPYGAVPRSRFGSGRYGDERGPEKGKPPSTVSQMPPVKSGPVVLDKFGNFRLASADGVGGPGGTGGPSGGGTKPPEPGSSSAGLPMRHHRSRSKSRHRTYGSSRSRSRSRSERRRSRSTSFRRRFSRSRSRSFSRSRSGGSYSRSRSRSRSFERRRFDRRIYRGGRGGGGGYGGGDRMGPFGGGGNRFNNSRGHYRRGGGGGGGGGFRDFRDNRFVRGGGGGGGGRDRPPFRPRYRGRFQRSYSRSMSKSPDRRPISPGDDHRPARHRDSRRGDSRDRLGTGHRGGGSRDRSSPQPPPSARRASSRGDSRENQREGSRHRRSEDRETSSKRTKENDGGNVAAVAPPGGAANDSSPESGRAAPAADGGGKSRSQRRSSSAGSQRSSGSTKIPHDIEGRWADDDGGNEDDQKRSQRQGEDAVEQRAGSHSSSNAAAAASAVTDDVSLEELEKMLTKARKERKEEMLERNKDMLKKSSSGY
uniref:TPR_REGION domain-containing protein n=1 Tax=Anopheles dirus TaxID=7168 RepID=A0A182NBJ4_9DIPT